MNKMRPLTEKIQQVKTMLWPRLVTAVLLSFPEFAVAAHPDVLINFTLSGNQVSSPDTYGHYWNNMTSVTTSVGLTNLITTRSEEHTSELQSLRHLVCRLL